MKKKLLYILGIMASLQGLRMVFKAFAFLIVKRTLLSDVIVNCLYMSIIIYLGLRLLKKRRVDIELFPKRFNVSYIILSVLLAFLFIVTPIITKNFALLNILSLIYNAIITVVYEEILFRGFIYEKLNFENERYSVLVTSILFGLWHLGYIDTIIWRVSIFSHGNIGTIMFYKVLTGFILGIMFGFLRYKNKNVYSSMILHSVINIIES